MSANDPLNRVRSASNRLQRSEYTGENRCMPCTAVNLALALLGAAILAMLARPVAVVFFLVAVVLIYLRGYLVPGTPALTRRFLPDRVLALFDHHSSPEAVAADDEVNMERILQRAAAITDAEDDDDLHLTPAFRREWYDRMSQLRGHEDDQETLAPVLGADSKDITFEDHGDAFVMWIDDHRSGQWESHAAFLADVAGGELLAERSPDWTALSVAQRSAVLAGLRIFLNHCPACGGPTTLGTDTVESCCRSVDVIAVSCDDCGARLFEESYDAVRN